MSLLKKYYSMSPHMRTAVMVAPLLLVGGYIAADYFETSGKGVDRLFELAPVGNCVIQSGCDFKGAGSSVSVIPRAIDARNTRIDVSTGIRVTAAKIEVVTTEGSVPPQSMRPGAGIETWTIDVPVGLDKLKHYHLVLSTGEAFVIVDSSAR